MSLRFKGGHSSYLAPSLYPILLSLDFTTNLLLISSSSYVDSG